MHLTAVERESYVQLLYRQINRHFTDNQRDLVSFECIFSLYFYVSISDMRSEFTLLSLLFRVLFLLFISLTRNVKDNFLTPYYLLIIY